MLTPEKKYFFMEQIRALQELFAIEFEEAKPSSTLEALEQFENQLTLNELEACFLSSDSEELHADLMQLLARRWERTRNSSLCYTQKPKHLVNILCFDLAKALAPPAETKLEIEALEPRTGPYFLLMPSLTHHEDSSFQNIHAYNFHEFILSENQNVFIPIADCLHNASDSDECILRHQALINERCPPLTASEEERITKHSKEATQWHEAILKLNLKRFPPEGIIGELQKLAFALKGGGVHATENRAQARAQAQQEQVPAQEEKEIPGKDDDSGSIANIGILVFKEYWNGVPEQQQNIFFKQFDGLEITLGRLFRPNDANYQDVVYCVEMLSENIRTLLEKYGNIPGCEELDLTVSMREDAFRQAANNQTLVLTHVNTNQPRRILPLIHSQLDLYKQKAFFSHDRCDNALIYACKHAPESLPEFDEVLDAASKQAATLLQFGIERPFPLMHAARKGRTDTMDLLLRWGADIEAQNYNGDRVLHWAAYDGHGEAVRYLLDKGASLEAKGYQDNTALHNAISKRRTAVVELLLQRNASLNARNATGKNALKLAMEQSIELTKLILMHLATRSGQQQADCLLYATHHNYPNVLFYVAEHHPSLFETVLNKIIEAEQFDTLYNTRDLKGETPLILAAKLGSLVGIQKLLDLGLDIEEKDKRHITVLYRAACEGHVEIVSFLLANKASLDTRVYQGNTALHGAILTRKNAVATLLLENHASISIRNDGGKNALDLALEKDPQLIQAILMRLATRPIEEQTECLSQLPNGPYSNVLFYAAEHQQHLFDNLVTTCTTNQPREFFTSSNAQNETPLLLASQLGSVRSIRQLLSLNINIETHDIDHNTALHWAIQRRHPHAVECLLTHGASLHARNNKGTNALDIVAITFPHLYDRSIFESVLSHILEEQHEIVIELLAEIFKQQTHFKLQNLLDVDAHILYIIKHYQKMKEKMQSNSNYRVAALTAKTLLIKCIQQRTILNQSKGSELDLLTFKYNCVKIIEKARPVLKKYREWAKVLFTFLAVVLALPIALPLYACGFFSIKTKSEQLLDDLRQEVENIPLVAT